MSDSARPLPDFPVRVERPGLGDVIPSGVLLGWPATAEPLYAGIAHAGMAERATARLTICWVPELASRGWLEVRQFAVRLASHVIGEGPARVAVYECPVVTAEYAWLLVPLAEGEEPPPAPEHAFSVPCGMAAFPPEPRPSGEAGN